MSTYSLQLLDFPVDYKIKPIVLGPRVYIALKTYGTKVWRKGNKEIEFTTISPECVTLKEFEYQINRLIEELETIKKQGKIFFEKELKKRADFSGE
jgi:hypothetical protein